MENKPQPEISGGSRDSALSRRERVALAAGSLSSLYFLPITAQAVPVHISSPITLSLSAGDGTTVGWDVDRNGTDEFQLRLEASRTIVNPTQTQRSYGRIFLDSLADARGLVSQMGAQENVKALTKGITVGPTADLPAGYGWRGSGNSARGMLTQTSRLVSGYQYNAGPGLLSGNEFLNGGMGPGDQYFGFRFWAGGGVHYGFGVLNFDFASRSVTIKRWTYNDEINQSLTVPEPGTASLTLLGLGAAGIRAWRRRRQLQEAS